MDTRIISNLKAPIDTWDISADDLAPTSDYDLNPAPRAKHPLTAAAVLVPLVTRSDGYTVLLTQRTDHLHDHAGQISFPGGRAEDHDRSPIATALREATEEIGLDAEFVEVRGLLDYYETVTGYLVVPVVGIVSTGFELILDDFEVAEAFEVPLDFLLEPANRQRHRRMLRGKERRYYVYEYEDRYIWGATAGILTNLARRISGEIGV